MTVQIRRHVFETNSSSSHSVSYSNNATAPLNLEVMKRSLDSRGTGVIVGTFGEYGWGYECLNSFDEKLSYALTSIRYFDNGITENAEQLMQTNSFQWINEVLQESVGLTLVLGGSNDLGYIDHQSSTTLSDYDFMSHNEDEFKAGIRNLLFNESICIIIDNDNH